MYSFIASTYPFIHSEASFFGTTRRDVLLFLFRSEVVELFSFGLMKLVRMVSYLGYLGDQVNSLHQILEFLRKNQREEWTTNSC